MKTRTSWDDDEIQFAGFGSAHAVSDHVPAKPKKRKAKVGFVSMKRLRAANRNAEERKPRA